MAIRVMHSFDYSNSFGDLGLTGYGGGTTFSTDYHRTGPQSLRIGSHPFYSTGRFSYALGVQTTTAWCQFAVYFTDTLPYSDSLNSDDRGDLIAFWQDETLRHIRISFRNTLHSILVMRESTLLYETANDLLIPYTWMFVEAKVVLHDTNGSVLVKLNGAEVVNLTGVDTNNGGSYISRIRHSGQTYRGAGGGEYPTYFDDLMAGDGTEPNSSPPGDSRVEYLVPIAAGSKTHFTPSAGSNWGNVDETVGPSDTDYNYSPDVGATDLFSMSNLAANGTVHAVQTIIRGRKDDAGFRLVKPAIYLPIGQGDTIRLYSSYPAASVGDSFGYSRNLLSTSPDTGSAWTVEELADLQFGYMVGGGNQFSLDCWIASF